MQQELIEMLEKVLNWYDYIGSDSYYAKDTGELVKEAEALIEKAKNNAPAVPQDLIDKAKRAVKNPADEAQANGSSETWVSAQERLILSVIDAATPASAPAQEPETALQKFTRFKVAETEGNPVEMLRAFCAFAMNSQDWFDVEPFFDLVREAMASRTAVAPAQEMTLTDEEICECFGIDGADDWVFKGARAIIAALRAKENKL